MSTPPLPLGPDTPFTEKDRDAMVVFWNELEKAEHPERTRFQAMCLQHIERIAAIQSALKMYPRIFSERKLGNRSRGLGTLVELLANATDADFEMFLPTRATLWRSLIMARLNFWRLLRYLSEEISENEGSLLQKIRSRVHASVYLKLMDELLTSLAMDTGIPRQVRSAVVTSLTSLWDGKPSANVLQFFPLLRAVWDARRNIMVSVGTMLGISEIMKLLQAGCAPQFVEYFARASMTVDEGLAFQEFLIGVTTEQIQDLEALMVNTGQTALTSKQANQALGRVAASSAKERRDSTGVGVQTYQFHRERHLEAAARRLRNLPGPKHTAEEYMLLYFLEEHLDTEALG